MKAKYSLYFMLTVCASILLFTACKGVESDNSSGDSIESSQISAFDSSESQAVNSYPQRVEIHPGHETDGGVYSPDKSEYWHSDYIATRKENTIQFINRDHEIVKTVVLEGEKYKGYIGFVALDTVILSNIDSVAFYLDNNEWKLINTNIYDMGGKLIKKNTISTRYNPDNSVGGYLIKENNTEKIINASNLAGYYEVQQLNSDTLIFSTTRELFTYSISHDKLELLDACDISYYYEGTSINKSATPASLNLKSTPKIIPTASETLSFGPVDIINNKLYYTMNGTIKSFDGVSLKILFGGELRGVTDFTNEFILFVTSPERSNFSVYNTKTEKSQEYYNEKTKATSMSNRKLVFLNFDEKEMYHELRFKVYDLSTNKLAYPPESIEFPKKDIAQPRFSNISGVYTDFYNSNIMIIDFGNDNLVLYDFDTQTYKHTRNSIRTQFHFYNKSDFTSRDSERVYLYKDDLVHTFNSAKDLVID